MKAYHQPYSEIQKMPADKLDYFVELELTLRQKEKKDLDKKKKEFVKKSSRRKR